MYLIILSIHLSNNVDKLLHFHAKVSVKLSNTFIVMYITNYLLKIQSYDLLKRDKRTTKFKSLREYVIKYVQNMNHMAHNKNM